MDEQDVRVRAEEGDPITLNQLGMRLLEIAPSSPGHERSKYLAQAFSNFERSARLGDPEGMWNTGWRYWLGEGVERDEMKAVLIWQRAANLGHQRAADHLATLKEQALSSGLDNKIIEDLRARALKAKENKLIFLLIGRTGVGKTTTIRKFLGKNVGEVNAFRPATTDVFAYEEDLNGIPVRVIDTPGLCDAPASKSNDVKYLESIRGKVAKFHCAWFVTRLDERRVETSEMTAIELISKSLGAEVWKHGIIVFTHADKVEHWEFEGTLQERTKLIQEQIAQHVGRDIAGAVPAVAVGSQFTTPDGKPWLAELFMQVWRRIDELGKLGLLLSGVVFQNPRKPDEGLRIPLSSSHVSEIASSSSGSGEGFTTFLTTGYFGSPVGLIIGSAIGGPVGGLIGVGAAWVAGAVLGWFTGRD